MRFSTFLGLGRLFIGMQYIIKINSKTRNPELPAKLSNSPSTGHHTHIQHSQALKWPVRQIGRAACAGSGTAVLGRYTEEIRHGALRCRAYGSVIKPGHQVAFSSL